MYGGLFGDLPATKKNDASKGETNDSDASSGLKAEAAPTETAETETVATTKNKTVSPPNATSAHSASFTIQQPLATATKAAAIVKAKAMATASREMMLPRFVPSQIRPKLPVSSQPAAKSNKAQTISDCVRTAVSTIQSTGTSSFVTHISSLSSVYQPPPEGDDTTTATTSVTKSQTDPLEKPSLAPTTAPTTVDLAHRIERDDLVVDDISPEEVYDPLLPNDVLLYWQHTAAEKERQHWERLRDDKLQEEQELQAQLHQERLRLNESTTTTQEHEQSNANNVAAPWEQRRTTGNIGRGRGGLSNLPAWLVKQQEQQLSEEAAG